MQGMRPSARLKAKKKWYMRFHMFLMMKWNLKMLLLRGSRDGNESSHEILGSFFCQSIESRLGDIARRIDYEQDVFAARNEVFDVVGNIGGLTLLEMIFVSTTLVQKIEN